MPAKNAPLRFDSYLIAVYGAALLLENTPLTIPNTQLIVTCEIVANVRTNIFYVHTHWLRVCVRNVKYSQNALPVLFIDCNANSVAYHPFLAQSFASKEIFLANMTPVCKVRKDLEGVCPGAFSNMHICVRMYLYVYT